MISDIFWLWLIVSAVFIAGSIIVYRIGIKYLNKNETLPEPYSIDQIVKLAKMAKAAYQTTDQNIKDYGQNYRIVVRELSKCKGRVLLLFDDVNRVQYISNRGTDNVKNFIYDGEYVKEFDEKTGIYIHLGFLESSREIYESISTDLLPDYKTYITGHSLGAAEATILHLFLLSDGRQVERTINFGQPKFTNSEGAARYADLPVLRVVHGKDVVPLVPPLNVISELHGMYRHFGDQMTLLNGMYYSFLNKKDVKRYASASFWGNAFKINLSLEDHYMDNYIQSLEGKLVQSVSVPFHMKHLPDGAVLDSNENMPDVQSGKTINS